METLHMSALRMPEKPPMSIVTPVRPLGISISALCNTKETY